MAVADTGRQRVGGRAGFLALALAGVAWVPRDEREELRALVERLEAAAALERIEEQLRSGPSGDDELRELEARCLYQLGRYEDCAARLTEHAPASPAGKLLLARCLARLGRAPEEATSLVDAACPDPRARQVARAEILLLQGSPADAWKSLHGAFVPGKGDLAEWVAAEVLEAFGENERALESYRAVLGQECEDVDVEHRRAARRGVVRVLAALGRHEEALAAAEALLAAYPAGAEDYLQLSTIQGVREHFADAIASLRAAVRLEPTWFHRVRLGDLLRTQKLIAEAREEYRRAAEAAPAAGIPRLRLAQVALEEDDLELCARELAAARAVLPGDSVEVLEVEARWHEARGERELAVQGYRKALARDPLRFESQYRLGLLLARGSADAERAEGRALLERYARIQAWLPQIQRVRLEMDAMGASPRLLARMAGFLNLAGDYGTAALFIQRALAGDPAQPAAHVQAAYIEANRGNAAAALRHFEEAQRLLGDAPSARVQEYIDTLRLGLPLPLPLGSATRANERE